MIGLSKKTDYIILGIFGVILILAIVYGLRSFGTTNTKATASSTELSIATAFRESGAESVQTSARCWELLDNKFHSSNEMAAYYESIREVLGDDNMLTFEEYDDQGYIGFSAAGVTEDGYHLNLVLQSMGERNTEDETYLIAELTDKSGNCNIDELRRRMETIFAVVNSTAEPSFMIEGKYEDLLSKREKKRISKSIFTLMDADIENKVSDGSYLSYSGYTEKLPESRTVNNRLINLQTALSDNEEEGCTHIFIGTPVVFSDF